MRKSRYNIGHFLPWTTIGGVECATLRIAQSVEGEEFKNTAFHLSNAPIIKEMFTKEGFDTSSFQSIEPSYHYPIPFLRATFSLVRELKQRNIDLVHCADLTAVYYTALAGRLAGVPVLCHIRNRFAELSRREKSFLYGVNNFAFVSHDSWKHFAYKVPLQRGTVIYDGIDVNNTTSEETGKSVRRQYNIPENAKIIGMVARVAPQKDYATLIRAAERIVTVEKDVRFLIVGDHSGTDNYRRHYEEVKQMLEEKNLTPYFIFTDFQSDVIRFLDAMDIFVLTTHCEGLPLVILEAMAQGKPVIASAVDGVPEIVVHEKTGLLHRHEDDAQLFEQILSLLQNEESAERLGEAGRQAVIKDWSRERFAGDMKNLYRKILVGKKKSLDERWAADTPAQFEENKA
jgi:glycosyltransferase involved in cell wall biosynthesis